MVEEVEVIEDIENHQIVKELTASKRDQVAQIIAAGMRGCLHNPNVWLSNCEAVYERFDKGRKINFALFSNAGDLVGKPVREKPFFQIEVDVFTKKIPPIPDLPMAFGLSRGVLNNLTLRDMAYPYLFFITVLIKRRGYQPTAIYFDEGEDRPLQLELVGGRCVWRIMLWQNRLIREYNELIKLIPELAAPDDGQYEKILEMRDNLKKGEDIVLNTEDNEARIVQSA